MGHARSPHYFLDAFRSPRASGTGLTDIKERVIKIGVYLYQVDNYNVYVFRLDCARISSTFLYC